MQQIQIPRLLRCRSRMEKPEQTCDRCEIAPPRVQMRLRRQMVCGPLSGLVKLLRNRATGWQACTARSLTHGSARATSPVSARPRTLLPLACLLCFFRRLLSAAEASFANHALGLQPLPCMCVFMHETSARSALLPCRHIYPLAAVHLSRVQ